MAFKMKGYSYPGESPMTNYKDTTKYKAFEGGNEAGSVLKQKVETGTTTIKEGAAKTGHGAEDFPDVVYKSDGTAVKTSQIDEELLDLEPSVGPKGKFVNYTAEDGTKIKYHYKKP